MKQPSPSVGKPGRPKIKIRDIAVISILSVILYAVQVTLAFIPNIELVSLLIVIYTLVLGGKAFFIIYTFIMLEGLTYGFGLWWLNYLYIWAVLAAIVLIMKKLKIDSLFAWTVINALYGLAFGFLCSISYIFMGGPSMMFSYWIAGIPFDIAHCIGNFFVTLVLFKPIRMILEKLYKASYLRAEK